MIAVNPVSCAQRWRWLRAFFAEERRFLLKLALPYSGRMDARIQHQGPIVSKIEGSSAWRSYRTCVSTWRWSMNIAPKFRAIVTADLPLSIVSVLAGISHRQQLQGPKRRSDRLSDFSHWIAVVALILWGATNTFAFWPSLCDVQMDRQTSDSTSAISYEVPGQILDHWKEGSQSQSQIEKVTEIWPFSEMTVLD